MSIITNFKIIKNHGFNLNKYEFYGKHLAFIRQTNQYISSNCIISPSHVLSKSNKEKCIGLLSSAKPVNLASKPTLKKAAVLVPICEVNEQVALLYLVRALHLRINGGEVAFPGGKFDEADGSLEVTALRETYEELGIPSSDVNIWGRGPDINRGDIVVTPLLGYIGKVNIDKLQINLNEVSQVFSVSLKHLSSAENFRVTKFRLGKSKVHQTPVYIGASKTIWGLTAYITHLVLVSLIPEIYNKNIHYQPRFEKIFFLQKKS